MTRPPGLRHNRIAHLHIERSPPGPSGPPTDMFWPFKALQQFVCMYDKRHGHTITLDGSRGRISSNRTQQLAPRKEIWFSAAMVARQRYSRKKLSL